MCARVCPTEILCEDKCVRNTSEDKPVNIGMLQRYAVDHLMEKEQAIPSRGQAPSGKRVAVVGGGPAGLSCAHRLAMLGHEVTIFDAKSKLGGLNEYGIAAYKTVNKFRPGGGGFHPLHRRHQREDRARRWAATSRSISCAASSTPCSSASAFLASMPSGLEGEDQLVRCD